jgi:hypothetical protein
MKRATWKRAAVVLALVLGVWTAWHKIFDGNREVKRLVNQIWIERMPANERDMIWVGVLMEDGRDRVGIVAHGSQWRVHADAMLWKLDGELLRTHFLQDNKRYDFRARTWECEGKAPKPFELCLELKRGKEVFRFYSRKDWELDGSGEGLPPALAGFIPQARGTLRAAHGQEMGEAADDEGEGPFSD